MWGKLMDKVDDLQDDLYKKQDTHNEILSKLDNIESTQNELMGRTFAEQLNSIKSESRQQDKETLSSVEHIKQKNHTLLGMTTMMPCGKGKRCPVGSHCYQKKCVSH
jgi:hypothetical protein